METAKEAAVTLFPPEARLGYVPARIEQNEDFEEIPAEILQALTLAEIQLTQIGFVKSPYKPLAEDAIREQAEMGHPDLFVHRSPLGNKAILTITGSYNLNDAEGISIGIEPKMVGCQVKWRLKLSQPQTTFGDPNGEHGRIKVDEIHDIDTPQIGEIAKQMLSKLHT